MLDVLTVLTSQLKKLQLYMTDIPPEGQRTNELNIEERGWNLFRDGNINNSRTFYARSNWCRLELKPNMVLTCIWQINCIF
jgi:hypothetical protein